MTAGDPIRTALDAGARKARAGRIRPSTTLTSDGDRVERRGDGAIFLMASDGWRYHVYDVRIADGRVRKARYESADAAHRVFVAAGGMRRTYTFGRGEVRTITASALERQFTSGVYLTEGPLANRPMGPR